MVRPAQNATLSQAARQFEKVGLGLSLGLRRTLRLQNPAQTFLFEGLVRFKHLVILCGGSVMVLVFPRFRVAFRKGLTFAGRERSSPFISSKAF